MFPHGAGCDEVAKLYLEGSSPEIRSSGDVLNRFEWTALVELSLEVLIESVKR